MEIISSVWRSLFRHRTRSILTIAGIAIGIFAVVLISVISSAGKFALTDEMSKMGMDSVTITPKFDQGGVLTPRELAAIVAEEGVLEASPLFVEYAEVSLRNESTKAVVLGVNENANQIVSLERIHGRLLNKQDIQQKREVCIVNEDFAKLAYKRSNIVGKSITILISGIPRTLEVVGVAETGGSLMQGMMGEQIPNFIYIPSSVQQLYNGYQSYDGIVARLKSGVDAGAVSDSLTKTMAGLLGIADPVRVENLSAYKQQFEQILDGATLILALIAGISLLVAGLSIMTMMLTAVSERTREIGVKKSIGATGKRIVFEFLLESAALSFLGGIFGILIGLLAGGVGCTVMGAKFVIDGGLLTGCLLFSLATGIVFGAYPAGQAAKLRPVEALRQDR